MSSQAESGAYAHIRLTCDRCKESFTPWPYPKPLWCEKCEMQELHAVSMRVTRDKDTWQVEFCDVNETKILLPKRNVKNSAVLFQIVARSYDPAGSLDRLARVIYRERLGSVGMRLTIEQYETLCRAESPRRTNTPAPAESA